MIQSPAGYQGDVRIKRYLDFYQPGYGVAMLSSGVAFSPLSLFAQGEQGGWYDPSDFSTLFQDSAGTTPVTAVEQPVGRVLDKSGRGNHLSQSTSTARPVLSARVNLLTRTEEFSHSDWVKSASENITVSANATTAPDGTSTADLLYPTASGSACYTYQKPDQTRRCTISVYEKAAGKNVVWVYLRSSADGGEAYFDLSDQSTQVVAGSVSTFTATITPVGDGWYRLEATASASLAVTGFAGAGFGVSDAKGSLTITKSGTNGAYIWGADLRPANAGVGLPAYQRVGASTDYDATGFPYYLRFDGTDDFLASGTINPGSVDKAQVFAGVRKLSDATLGMLAEYGPSVNGTLGTWGHILPDTTSAGSLGLDLCGNGSSGIQRVSTGTAPATFVSATGFDLSGTTYETERPTKRVNGAAATVLSSAGATDTGGGNFSSQALYVGRRAGTSLPFNGQLYSLILRFSATNMDAATISSTETWVNQKTLAY